MLIRKPWNTCWNEVLKPKNNYQQTALHYLAEGESRYKVRSPEKIEKCVEILLGARVSALMRDDGAGNILCYHLAVRSGNAPFIYAMIKNKVKLDMLDKDGGNLLHIIADYPAGSAAHSIRYTNQEEEKEKQYKILDEWFDVAKCGKKCDGLCRRAWLY